MTGRKIPRRPKSYDKSVALVLQGGGALGSYQAGVYEALAGSPYLPDWVAGISIGAVNGAIIAGNAPRDRVARLQDFWDEITAPSAWWPMVQGSQQIGLKNQVSAFYAMMAGQPGFFSPRPPIDFFSREQPVSYYSTDDLRRTLERLVDFDRINSGEVRFSVGAVNVQTGQFAYFDSIDRIIGPEHVMASAALPPGFPPIEIDGEYYWDGGLVSNTPLKYVLDYYPRISMLAFQVDVFQGYGPIPENLSEVFEREKDIRYSSRTRVNTDAFREKHEMRHAINELQKALPPEIAATVQARNLFRFACVTEMDIVQLIYRPFSSQGAVKDYDFSRSTMQARWKAGLENATETLQASPWLGPKPPEVGVRTFDVIHDRLIAELQAS